VGRAGHTDRCGPVAIGLPVGRARRSRFFRSRNRFISPTTGAKWASAVRLVSADCIVADTPPSDDALAASIALGDVAVIPCLPSGLDLEATEPHAAIVNAVRARRADPLHVILVPNRVDSRARGQTAGRGDEAIWRNCCRPTGSRYAFVRAFNTGISIGEFYPNGPADKEVRALR
jgi:chromosome partitioning protein